MTIAGNKIQMPKSLAEMFITDEQGNVLSMKPEWAQFFHGMQGTLFAATRNGASTDRPTSTMGWRYNGMPFFDTSLSTHGRPIWLANASSNQWVDATGAVV